MKTKSLKQALMMLFGSIILLSACDKAPESVDEPEPIIPNFPELGEILVDAGEVKTFKFNVNSDWKISLPIDQAGAWFSIKSGQQTDWTISGEKGDVELTIVVGVEEEFDNTRTCDIVMEMNKTPKVIGVLKRGTLDREFSFSVARYDAETDVFLEKEEYIAVEGDNPIDLFYPANKSNYMVFAEVLANFDWVIADLPEWLEPKGTDEILYAGQEGVLKSFRFEAVNDKLPLDDATGTIVFADQKNAEGKFEYQVNMPGVRNLIRIANLPADIKFSAEGRYFNKENGAYQPEMGSNVLLRSTKDGASVYVASENGGPADWVSVNLAAWNNSSKDVIQARSLRFTTTPNPGDAVRKATVLVYPTALVSNPLDMFNGAEVKEEYKQYVATTITQEFIVFYGDDLVTSFLSNEELLEAGAKFVDHLPYYITGTLVSITEAQRACPDAEPFRLVVKNKAAMDAAALRVGVDDFSIEFLKTRSSDNGEITTSATSLKGVYVERDGAAIVIKTDVDPTLNEEIITDYIILRDNKNNIAFAVIEFIFNPKADLAKYDYSNPATAWLVEPAAAAAAGLTFAPAVPDLDPGQPGERGYRFVSGQYFQAPMYELMQTKPGTSAKIAVSREYASIEYWSATSGAVISRPNDGQNSEAVWINFNRETGEVSMVQKIGNKGKNTPYNEQDGAILFKDADGNIFLVVCCYMRFDNPAYGS